MAHVISHYNAFGINIIIQAVLTTMESGRGFERAFRRMLDQLMFPDNKIYFITSTELLNDQGIFKYNIIEKLYKNLDSIEETEYALVHRLFSIKSWIEAKYPDIYKEVFISYLVRSEIDGKYIAIPHINIDLISIDKKDKKWKKTFVNFLDEMVFAFRTDDFHVYARDLHDEEEVNIMEYIEKQKASVHYC